MNIRRLILNWLKEGEQLTRLPPCESPKASLHLPEYNTITFRVCQAQGGTIIKTSAYDEKSDQNHDRMYVVQEGEPVGKALEKIITMESLIR